MAGFLKALRPATGFEQPRSQNPPALYWYFIEGKSHAESGSS